MMSDHPAFPSLRLRMGLLAYAALWVLGLPLVLLYLWRRGCKDVLYSAYLGERFGVHRPFAPGAVWVHAVSLGELRSAVPMIRALLDRGDSIVTTHFTPAGRREAERAFADDIAAGRMRVAWVPFEFGFAYRRFFKAFAPKCGLVMEIEIWPRMIFAARAAGVPLYMCNAQYPSKSFARDGRTGFRAQVMQGFAGALVKSDLQAQRFASVGVENIRVTGELRFDQPIPPHLLDAGVAARAWLGANQRRVITIASAVEGEDDLYIAAVLGLRAAQAANGLPPPLFVYVPRKPERFDDVAMMLETAGLVVGKRSTLLDAGFAPTGTAPQIDVLLGDSLGEMYAYLAMADMVIVGGGFTPKGAHNIIEPLALRKPVIVGPVIHTIEYPAVEAIAAGVCWKMDSPEHLRKVLLANTAPDPAAIEAFFNAHSGATARTIAALDQLLTSR
jgi:3-deoxy-D-manno-octulosonic-acid transferase